MKIKLITVIIGVLLMSNVYAGTFVLMKTNHGDIKIELYDEKSPITVKNFITYVESGFYDKTIFHRVIDGFMIQGGGFTSDFKEKETMASIQNEADNGLSNEIGTLAMARTPEPHSASSQFFINVANNTFLNFKNKTPNGYGYAVFGKVVDGMDVVNRIAKVKTGKFMYHSDVPRDSVVIESVKIIFNNAENKDKAVSDESKVKKTEPKKKTSKADKKK